jgi:hypothetical protein
MKIQIKVFNATDPKKSFRDVVRLSGTTGTGEDEKGFTLFAEFRNDTPVLMEEELVLMLEADPTYKVERLGAQNEAPLAPEGGKGPAPPPPASGEGEGEGPEPRLTPEE